MIQKPQSERRERERGGFPLSMAHGSPFFVPTQCDGHAQTLSPHLAYHYGRHRCTPPKLHDHRFSLHHYPVVPPPPPSPPPPLQSPSGKKRHDPLLVTLLPHHHSFSSCLSSPVLVPAKLCSNNSTAHFPLFRFRQPQFKFLLLFCRKFS